MASDSANSSTNLSDVFDLLSPRGLGARVKSDQADRVPIDEQVRTFLIDKGKKFEDIKGLIEAFFTRKNLAAAGVDAAVINNQIQGIARDLHGISKNFGTLCEKVDYQDSKYWSQRGDKGIEDSPGSLFKQIFGDLFEDVQCDVSIFASTDPYLSPAVASTEDVELFLNYTPSIVANQMVPYLEVEFASNKQHNRDPSFSHLSTPSILRFLLGSVPIGPSMPLPTQSLIRIREAGKNQITGALTTDVLAGMELFLSPQSLTNMRTLDGPSRLVPVKPFLPFASIANFEVTILNAGSGAMAHKKGKLQIIIHDKARIAEMSEFFRGPSGYGTMKIWTSYGWIAASRNDASEDQYARFINSTMHMEDCWQVMNSQFQFDQTGKVQVTLDLVGLGAGQVSRTSIKVASGLQKTLNGFNKILEEIKETSRNILKQPLGPDARITQILNAASSGGMLPADIKVEQLDKIIEATINTYVTNGTLDGDKATKFIGELKNVLNPTKYKQGIAIKRAEALKDQIINIKGHDPFLAGEVADESKQNSPLQDFFNPDLIKEISYFFNPPPIILTEEAEKAAKDASSSTASPTPPPGQGDNKEIPRPTISLDKNKKVMSFGKLFCSLALPAIIEANLTTIKANKAAEVQVLFYALNDECGPVSGASLAEFPIDMERLAYALDDSLKILNRSDMTIDEFLKVVINSQFGDDRSIGYGMLSKNLFAPFDKDKPGPANQEKNKLYESALAEWQAKNPTFAKPVIEMVLETTKPEETSASRIHNLQKPDRPPAKDEQIILRIHLYDKQSNPRKLFTQIMEISGQLFVGAFNDSEQRRRLSAKSSIKDKIEEIGKLQKEFEDAQKSPTSAEAVRKLAAEKGFKLKTPDGRSTPIPIEQKLYGPYGIRANLQKLAPNLIVGIDGTLIKTATLQSKTDGLMAAANLVNIMKPKDGGSSNTTEPPPTGLEGPGGLPLRTVPAQLNITTVGCPAARLMQQYFVDLQTGTSLDNLYTCTQVAHKLSPGKFETTMTFAFTDGYGKFTAPPSIATILSRQGKQLQQAQADAEAAAAAAATPAKKPGTGKENPKKPTKASDPAKPENKPQPETPEFPKEADPPQDPPPGTHSA